MRIRNLLLVASAMLILGCSKDDVTPTEQATITLSTSNTDRTRTHISDGVECPKWENDDAIGVMIEDYRDSVVVVNRQLSSTIYENGVIAVFSGSLGTTLPANEYTIYAYHPYGGLTFNNSSSSPHPHAAARVLIPIVQQPKINSYDPKADILFTTPRVVTYQSGSINLELIQFHRATALIKVVFANVDAQLGGEPITKFSLTSSVANKYLTGRVNFNLNSGEFGDFYSSAEYKSNAVSAEFNVSKNMKLNGDNAIYLSVNPVTFVTGERLIVTAETYHYTISKTIPLSQDINLQAGDMTTLRISLPPGTITAKPIGSSLPFHEDFSFATQGTSTSTTGQNNWSTYPCGTDNNIASGSNIATAGGAVKFGSSNETGSITTKSLDLSHGTFEIKVRVKGWTNKTSTLTITAGESVFTQSIVGGGSSSTTFGEWQEFTFSSSAQGAMTQVIFASSGSEKRLFIDDIQIYYPSTAPTDPQQPDGVPTGWLELPLVTEGSTLHYIKHYTTNLSGSAVRNYSMLYDHSTYTSYWVAYPLHQSYFGSADRSDAFNWDPSISQAFQTNIKTGGYGVTASNGQPYARGHQIPSNDRTANDDMNIQTFYATNMTPQWQTLNGGRWASIESLLHSVAVSTTDTIYVVTGAMLRTATGNETITYITNVRDSKSLPLPNYYYKVAIRKSGSTYTGVGFWVEHEGTIYSTNKGYCKTIREIEELTGFNFFANLPVADQNNAETAINYTVWGM